MSNVGVIGLGAMGSGMAGSLRRAGHTVFVCDARPGAAQAFAADGGVALTLPETGLAVSGWAGDPRTASGLYLATMGRGL